VKTDINLHFANPAYNAGKLSKSGEKICQELALLHHLHSRNLQGQSIITYSMYIITKILNLLHFVNSEYNSYFLEIV
jgi:hypothetical protein